MIKREGNLIHCTKYYYIRVFVSVIISAKLLLSSWSMKCVFISVILWAGCNEIKSNKHYKMWNVSRGEKSKKKKMKIRTQNEKIVETAIDVWY